MSLTSRTNRWASRVIIILQLATWNAVGIILLHRGVSTLRTKILESNYVTETDSLESVVSSTSHDGSEYNLSTQRQLVVDKNLEIIIQIDPDRSSPHSNRNLSGLEEIRDVRLTDTFEAGQQGSSTFLLANTPTTVQESPSSQLENHVMGTDRHVRNHFKNESRISRITRDREHIFGKGISRSIHEEENTTSIPEVLLPAEEQEEEDIARNATVRESSRDDETPRNRFALWTGKNNVKFSRVNEDGATTAVALVAIGAIMLLVGPIVIILRILDERRQARKLMALPASAREDPPPTYEQAVFMDEAPRYSTLALNYDHTPPPSPNLSSTYIFSNAT